ncbi:hypothetical protein GBA52_015187 [Prunus armeniaca]|nr:hypothetical protein GBA52_015187 [Prunus armeniaca]
MLIPIPGSLKTIKSSDKGFSEHARLVVLLSPSHSDIYFIQKYMVRKSRRRTSFQRVYTQILLHPCNLFSESSDGSICSVKYKICIINTITGIGQSDSCGISRIFIYCLPQCQKIPCGLGHLLRIEHQVPITSKPTRPMLPGHNCRVVVNTKC